MYSQESLQGPDPFFAKRTFDLTQAIVTDIGLPDNLRGGEIVKAIRAIVDSLYLQFSEFGGDPFDMSSLPTLEQACAVRSEILNGTHSIEKEMSRMIAEIHEVSLQTLERMGLAIPTIKDVIGPRPMTESAVVTQEAIVKYYRAVFSVHVLVQFEAAMYMLTVDFLADEIKSSAKAFSKYLDEATHTLKNLFQDYVRAASIPPRNKPYYRQGQRW